MSKPEKSKSEKHIDQSWHTNAVPWVQAVRDQTIPNRAEVTDRAIVQAVQATMPDRVLDVGCGEGWLVRQLASKGIESVGIDGEPRLIAAAREASSHRFQVLTYAELSELEGYFDACVCNFSLFGETSVEQALQNMRRLLMGHPVRPDGQVVIQTLHPGLTLSQSVAYRKGWREGSWQGFSEAFKDPAPWFFRTLSDWFTLFKDQGFELIDLKEPLHPGTGKPVSIIFTLSVSAINKTLKND